jgi:hypothetical protein
MLRVAARVMMKATIVGRGSIAASASSAVEAVQRFDEQVHALVAVLVAADVKK